MNEMNDVNECILMVLYLPEMLGLYAALLSEEISPARYVCTIFMSTLMAGVAQMT